MDLDELKSLWQEERNQSTDHSEEEIRAMLFTRSNSAMSRIHRNIVVEGILTILMGLFGLTVWLGGEERFEFLWIFLAALGLLGSIFYVRKYRQLKEVRLSAEDLKSTLQQNAAIMGSYMRFYHYYSVLLIPILSMSGVLYGYSVGAAEEGRTFADLSMTEWGILLGIGITYVAISYFAVRWYIDRLYGRHFREMKSCLKELDSSDGERE